MCHVQCLRAVAVEFDFVGPIRPFGKRGNQGAFHRLDKFSFHLREGLEPISAGHAKNECIANAPKIVRSRLYLCGRQRSLLDEEDPLKHDEG